MNQKFVKQFLVDNVSDLSRILVYNLDRVTRGTTGQKYIQIPVDVWFWKKALHALNIIRGLVTIKLDFRYHQFLSHRLFLIICQIDLDKIVPDQR